MDVIKMEKAPKIAVYSPPNMQPWDDAVTLVLTYAQIKYDVIYDKEVLDDKLPTYDWLHLHHEDFTGQYGKFWANYRNQPWYKEQQKESEKLAKLLGYNKVSELKLAVSLKIFAMCSATDSYDVSLAAAGVDICQPQFDHDPMDPNAQSKLDFNNTFAFKNFKISKNPYEYEISNIDINPYMRQQKIQEKNDYFTLFDFSAKWDPVPTMLCQNHTQVIKGFYGQTTAYNKDVLKTDVLVMGENKMLNEARYIHGVMAVTTPKIIVILWVILLLISA